MWPFGQRMSYFGHYKRCARYETVVRDCCFLANHQTWIILHSRLSAFTDNIRCAMCTHMVLRDTTTVTAKFRACYINQSEKDTKAIKRERCLTFDD